MSRARKKGVRDRHKGTGVPGTREQQRVYQVQRERVVRGGGRCGVKKETG